MNTDRVINKHSAGGIVIHKGKVLALSWLDRDFICLPKGGIEANETAEEAATREVAEETGYTVEPVRFLGSWEYSFVENGSSFHKKVDYYLMILVNENEKPQPKREAGENFVNLWLDIDQAATKLSYNDAREALDLALQGVS